MASSTRIDAVFYVFCLIAGAAAVKWTHIHVTYGHFFKIALTLKELLHSDPKYTLMAVDEEMNVELYSYGRDPSVAIMMDSYGHIAGVRACYIIERLHKRAESNGLQFNFTFHDKSSFSFGNYWGLDVWYIDIIYTSPEKLKAGGRPHLNCQAAEEVWAKLQGVWTQMPKHECDALSMGFIKEGCSEGMGMHYVQTGYPVGNCSVLEPIFLLYENCTLVGVGASPYGDFIAHERAWFEELPMWKLKIDVPLAPPCFYEWAEQYGSPVLHTYLVEHPKKLNCGLPYQDPDVCSS